MKSKTLVVVLVTGALGAALGFGAQLMLPTLARVIDKQEPRPKQETQRETAKQEILYWVAPMDPNFRRDTPGKSPMGMDLIPVYANQEADAEKDAAVVKISPAVVNNLGVRSVQVSRSDLRRRIETVGYIDYDEGKISHIHLRTDGWIERLRVRAVGELVKKGQILFELYSPTLVNAQAELLQSYKTQRTGLIEASTKRLRSLGITSAQIKALRARGEVPDYVTVRASQDGVLAELNVREGMYVKPDTTVGMLADLSSVWLLAEVFEDQAHWVTEGLPAEMVLPYQPGKVWKGRIEYVYPTVDSKTRTLKVRLRFDNPSAELKPNMYTEVTILGKPKVGALSIPREALIRTGNSERVILALGEGRFRPAEVVSGMEAGDRTEILSGLTETDEVVVSGQFLIDSESSLTASLERMDDRKISEQSGSEPGLTP
jgi:Cu(I)/Ag(I) efflux system membrane fusion protein